MPMSAPNSALIFFTIMAVLFGVSMATVYTVGDSAGWTATGIDYSKWADDKKFQVGDTLVFNYNPRWHDVHQVTAVDFALCNSKSVFATYVSGSDNITLKEPGHLYFICSFPGHCHGGQKVDILVSQGSASSTESPIESPNSTLNSPSVITKSSTANSGPSLCSYNNFWLVSGMLAINLAGFA